jgi:hypothetical protein
VPTKSSKEGRGVPTKSAKLVLGDLGLGKSSLSPAIGVAHSFITDICGGKYVRISLARCRVYQEANRHKAKSAASLLGDGALLSCRSIQ